ncbi:MAG: class I SAM-dependent DNA methyltransferase [Bacteroidota bacterium]
MGGSWSAEDFIAKWAGADGSEFANAQSFVADLCRLLQVDRPEPAVKEDHLNRYVFERWVTFRWSGDGPAPRKRMDCYKRGCFVLEAKKLAGCGGEQGELPHLPAPPARKGGKTWNAGMVRAREQAADYADAIGRDEGWPPFLIVVDIGNVIELFADFSLTGKHYSHFPDARSFRIALDDLRDDAVRDRLRRIWQEPLSLDPARQTARVTRAIAVQLAELAKALEENHPADRVAMFLMRCLFTMFAEDVGLLARDCFRRKLEQWVANPAAFRPGIEEIWHTMDRGGHSLVLEAQLRRFNGGLFADATALDLDAYQIKRLLEAAKAEWQDVDPAIFGTLLERALTPGMRKGLGAHYTPRAYVERLVLATVIEPLRDDWRAVKAAALLSDQDGAIDEVRAFHRRLCDIRVLDPACGTGNFLYVTLENLKRLEGEVVDFLTRELNQHQQVLELDTHTVDPRQFLGIEKNERAVAIAELVLWIGYLQWHFRTRGRVMPAEPVLRNFHTIEHRDAVLVWDQRVPERDDTGQPLSRWDGESMTVDLVTGREIPAAECRVPLYRYTNPRPADWPEADFIVGNPPFIGGKDLRQRLGDGTAAALRTAYPDVPDSADFVMYWWHLAAERVRAGRTRRFGFITTNSITQTFNRRVLAHHLGARDPLSLVFAIPDHPWVKTTREADREALRQAAAVRIAMTVAEAGEHAGILATLATEEPGPTDAAEVRLNERSGRIQPDLTIGAEVSAARPLAANDRLCSPGVKLHGAGFIVTPADAAELGLGEVPGLEQHIRPYLNGRDLTQRPRGVMVIDLFGLGENELRQRFPAVYQHVAETIKPHRQAKSGNTADATQYAETWWMFGKPRPRLRHALAGLPRYIATVETAKHRLFTFLDASILPDNMLVAIASADAFVLGVLSSRIHVAWALATGGTLEDRPRYNKTQCFDTFPFPVVTDYLAAPIRTLAEELDGFRKQRLAEHPDLTLTGLYNVVEKLKADEPLSAAERTVHDRGLAGTLRSIHDALDDAVFDAYGWPPSLGEAAVLERLVALNRQRTEDERRGHVAWLRPEFQAPAAGERAAPMLIPDDLPLPLAAKAAGKEKWPAALLDQVSAIRLRLNRLPAPAEPAAIAGTFKGARRDRVAEVLATLAAMGQARQLDGRYWRC